MLEGSFKQTGFGGGGEAASRNLLAGVTTLGIIAFSIITLSIMV
jgi:hypothetical protein